MKPLKSKIQTQSYLELEKPAINWQVDWQVAFRVSSFVELITIQVRSKVMSQTGEAINHVD